MVYYITLFYICKEFFEKNLKIIYIYDVGNAARDAADGVGNAVRDVTDGSMSSEDGTVADGDGVIGNESDTAADTTTETQGKAGQIALIVVIVAVVIAIIIIVLLIPKKKKD